MTSTLKKYFARRKRQILARLDKTKFEGVGPVLAGKNVHYEVAQRAAEISCGGLGMIHDMVQRLRLVDAINRSVALFKRYLPYMGHADPSMLAKTYQHLSQDPD